MREKKIDAVVKETLEDFENRIRARKGFDNQWQLNMMLDMVVLSER